MVLSQSFGTLQAKTLIMDGKQIEYQLPAITLYVNGNQVVTRVMDPIQLDNRVLVPAREVFEAMGASVGWDNIQKKVTVQYKSQSILLTINQTTALINGNPVEMDVPGKIINDKVMIPIRFVSEAIGMDVEWDATNRAVKINEKNTNSQKPSDVKEKTPIHQVVTNESESQFVATILAGAPIENVKMMTQEGKVILDISNSTSLLENTIQPEANTYVQRIRTSQFTKDTTRVVLDLMTEVKVNPHYSSDRTKYYVTLTKKGMHQVPESQPGQNEANQPNGSVGSNESQGSQIGLQGIQYRSGTKPTLTLAGVQLGQIKVKDDYRNKVLIFDLGADYSQQIPSTTMTPNDAAVSSIQVTNDGTTKIKVITKTVYTYHMSQSGQDVVLQLVRPKEKYSQIIVLDIGHGGSDHGAIGNGLTEKEINYNQGMALYKLLEADPNIKVYMTRETDVYPTLQFRSALANEIQADLFVSIHNNSAGPAIKGTETLYFPSATDKRGQEIAKLVQNNIVTQCQMTNRGIKARSDLYVLRTTDMPAILIETGFISNPSEATLINSSSFINNWARCVYEALVEGFKLL